MFCTTRVLSSLLSHKQHVSSANCLCTQTWHSLELWVHFPTTAWHLWDALAPVSTCSSSALFWQPEWQVSSYAVTPLCLPELFSSSSCPAGQVYVLRCCSVCCLKAFTFALSWEHIPLSIKIPFLPDKCFPLWLHLLDWTGHLLQQTYALFALACPSHNCSFLLYSFSIEVATEDFGLPAHLSLRGSAPFPPEDSSPDSLSLPTPEPSASLSLHYSHFILVP